MNMNFKSIVIFIKLLTSVVLLRAFRIKIKVLFGTWYYATKADLKEATCFDTSNLAAKADLACMKAQVDN